MTDFENRWRQAQEKCDVYVMCSTLNQIVNYLPVENLKNRESKSLEIINLSYEDGENKRFSNKMWDENFSTVYYNRYKERPWNEPEDIVKLPRRFKCDDYIRKIEYHIGERKNKNFIWNVTGGQRNILFTAMKYIESNADVNSTHTVMYLEGNTQKITVGYYDRNEWKFGAIKNSYRSDTIDLHNLFRLAGYETDISDAVFIHEGKNEGDFLNLLKAYSNFYSKLYEVNEEVRKKLIESNKWNKKENNANEFFKLLDGINHKGKVTDDIEIIKESLNNRSNYLFGYFLEYMAAAVIWNAVQEISKPDADFFQSLSHSVKVYKNDWNGKEKFCELDLVLLLRSGQTVVFECKSGFMSAENAKSREYTAYALGGVYGKPILITPLSEHEAVAGKMPDEYENITKAYSSARRAGLEVFHLDTLKEDLKDLFKDAL